MITYVAHIPIPNKKNTKFRSLKQRNITLPETNMDPENMSPNQQFSGAISFSASALAQQFVRMFSHSSIRFF